MPHSVAGWPNGFPVHRLQYPATDPAPHESDYWWKERSPIHMPKWAARVERLQDITLGDIAREGWPDAPSEGAEGTSEIAEVNSDGYPWFLELWNSISGDKPGASWDDSPWVWVVEFVQWEALAR